MKAQLKKIATYFIQKKLPKTLPKEQATILYAFLKDKKNYQEIKELRVRYGGSESEIRFLVDNLHEVPIHKFKTPLNFILASYEPEYRFVQSLLITLNYSIRYSNHLIRIFIASHILTSPMKLAVVM